MFRIVPVGGMAGPRPRPCGCPCACPGPCPRAASCCAETPITVRPITTIAVSTRARVIDRLPGQNTPCLSRVLRVWHGRGVLRHEGARLDVRRDLGAGAPGLG